MNERGEVVERDREGEGKSGKQRGRGSRKRKRGRGIRKLGREGERGVKGIEPCPANGIIILDLLANNKRCGKHTPPITPFRKIV